MNLISILGFSLAGCEQFSINPDRPQDFPDTSSATLDSDTEISEENCDGYWLDSSLGTQGCIKFSDDEQFSGEVTDNAHRGLSIYDFNHDGWDDLYLANSGTSDELYLNNIGKFERSGSDFGLEFSQNCHALIQIDVDTDGDEELACISDIGAFIYSSENGQYSRSSSFEFNMPARDGAVIESSLVLASENGVYQYLFNQTGDVDGVTILNSDCDASDLEVADYDLDGQEDFYVTCLTGSNRLYQKQSNDAFLDVTDEVGFTEDGFLNSTHVTWHSWSNQDYPLLSVSNYNGSDELYRREADGEFIASAQNYGVTASGPVVSSEWLNLIDESSVLLIKAQDEQPTLAYLLLNNQPIELLPEIANQIGLSVNSEVMETAVLDVNRDGLDDIAFVSWDGSVKLSINESKISE